MTRNRQTQTENMLTHQRVLLSTLAGGSGLNLSDSLAVYLNAQIRDIAIAGYGKYSILLSIDMTGDPGIDKRNIEALRYALLLHYSERYNGSAVFMAPICLMSPHMTPKQVSEFCAHIARDLQKQVPVFCVSYMDPQSGATRYNYVSPGHPDIPLHEPGTLSTVAARLGTKRKMTTKIVLDELVRVGSIHADYSVNEKNPFYCTVEFALSNPKSGIGDYYGRRYANRKSA